MTEQPRFTNRLLHETSPYLRQHAHNPVDWYPWGPEALERARKLDRPIFLSIGYSACHWCHVMEHESFEDPAIGQVLNDHFVSIKVDREERPDLDQIYMTAVQRMTRQGGWPMSMFLTPDLKPFFGGTYFPPDDRYGRPGFKRLLLQIVEAWRSRRPEIQDQSELITRDVQELTRVEPGVGELEGSMVLNAVHYLGRAFDRAHGGFGSAPKFPHPVDLRLLLRIWKRNLDEQPLDMVRITLDHMARGGIYDHLGGGFHRYSTDARWLVPHFEKMLYDNALLTGAYTDAYLATGDAFYREVVEETLAYVEREMTSEEGFFYSTQDADSEGEEGKFFVWSAREISEVLGKDLAEVFSYVYEVSAEGNWEGHNILNRSKSMAQQAMLLKLKETDLRSMLANAKEKLLAQRSRRIRPGRDEKGLTSWNGLMISALAQAAAALDRPDYAVPASRAADFMVTTMRRADGRLLRTYSTGSGPKLNGYLEDYAYLIDGLVSLYEATFTPHWIEEALELTDKMLEQFWDHSSGGFFYTGRDHETLIARTKDPHDSSVPSANSVAVLALLRLYHLTDRTELLAKAEATLRLFQGLMAQSPFAAGQMLIALDFFLGPVEECAVIGAAESDETKKILRVLRQTYRPNQVLAFRASGDECAQTSGIISLLKDKPSADQVATYICRDFACQTPLFGTDWLVKTPP